MLSSSRGSPSSEYSRVSSVFNLVVIADTDVLTASFSLCFVACHNRNFFVSVISINKLYLCLHFGCWERGGGSILLSIFGFSGVLGSPPLPPPLLDGVGVGGGSKSRSFPLDTRSSTKYCSCSLCSNSFNFLASSVKFLQFSTV